MESNFSLFPSQQKFCTVYTPMMLLKIDKLKLMMKYENRDMLDLVARRLRCYESEIGTKQSFEYRGKYFY